jgi:valyl-tRNA synthetase
MNVPPGKKVRVVLSAQHRAEADWLQSQSSYLEVLAKADPVAAGVGLEPPPAAGSAVVGQVEVYVALDSPADTGQERQRLGRELEKFRKLLQSQTAKLANQQFVANAPAAVVEKERQRLGEYELAAEKLQASLERLGV